MNEEQFVDFLNTIDSDLVSWRRDLHEHPEVGWTEYRTTAMLGEVLKSFGYQIHTGKDVTESSSRMGVPSVEELKEAEDRAREYGVSEAWLTEMAGGHTGVIATFDTGRSGPHIAYRFDIDALPIKESSEQTHFPAKEGFASKFNGNMHSCGHDGHAIIGLGVARFLKDFQDHLKGRFTLIFQPSEEGCRGAKAIVDKGWLDDADILMSGHLGIQSLEVGQIVAVCDGFLSTTKMDVTFEGVSAHAGGRPEQGKNALLAAATAALQMNGIARHSDGGTRINTGMLQAGAGRNIIADEAKMLVETRGGTTELNAYMRKEAERIINASAAMYDVQADIDVVGQGVTASCDREWIDIVQEACAASDRIQVIDEITSMGSEDVTYMMNRVQEKGGKATRIIFGTPLKNGHHHPEFDYDEGALGVGVEALARMTLQCVE